MNFDWIQTVVYLIPVATLVWKMALQSAEVKDLRHDLQKLEQKYQDEKHATDSVIVTLTSMLNDIKIAVTRIETKLEERNVYHTN